MSLCSVENLYSIYYIKKAYFCYFFCLIIFKYMYCLQLCCLCLVYFDTRAQCVAHLNVHQKDPEYIEHLCLHFLFARVACFGKYIERK